MKQLDATKDTKETRKRERDDKAYANEPKFKRPKFAMESKSAVYQSLFSRHDDSKVVVPDREDFMTRCAKWGL